MPTGDPRSPRKNPELSEIARAIRSSYGGFRKAETHAERRGRLAILQAHIEEFLAQPESLQDFYDGRPQGPREYTDPGPDRSTHSRGDPFADPDSYEDSYVLRSTGGGMSHLSDTSDMLEYLGEWPFGAVILTFRPLHLTEQDTVGWFRDEQALTRWAGRKFSHHDPRAHHYYAVFSDPLALPDRKTSVILYESLQQQKAIDMAESTSRRFGIRLLVAQLRGISDFH